MLCRGFSRGFGPQLHHSEGSFTLKNTTFSLAEDKYFVYANFISLSPEC